MSRRGEQPFAKPQFNPFDPDGRFVMPDKGPDRVFSFRFDAGPSDSIVAFAIDGGGLQPTGWSIACGSSLCMLFSATP